MKTKKIILLFIVSIMFTVSYSQITVKMPKIGFGKKEKSSNEVAQKTQTPEEKKAEEAKNEESKRQAKEQKKEVLLKECATAKCPVDEYTGADKAEIRSKIEAAWNDNELYCEKRKNKILGIYLGDEWETKRGYDDNMQLYDEDQLTVKVVTQNNEYPEIADVYTFRVWKNNLNESKKVKCPKPENFCGALVFNKNLLIQNVVKPK